MTQERRGRPWWEPGVIYQVYPRSFQDSDGDGVGDLRGILSRLDHLEWLGIDAIWLSPIFRSPMADFGYDISDYRAVDPLFGDLADLDRLIDAVHRRGMRILLDFVPNHTSSEHPWFIESRSSRDSPRRGWYLWAEPGASGGPPNNWRSVFGGPAWEWDAVTRQYYYHAFLKEQPDLDWRNPEVRAEMEGVLRFWLDRGVDGFRVDVIWHLIKDDLLRDDPPDPGWTGDPASYAALLPVHTTDRPEVHDVIARMRALLDGYGDRLLIGEVYLPVPRLVAYYGTHPHKSGAHLPFNFQLLQTPWEAHAVGGAILAYETALPPHAWPNWVLGNHDRSRIASRVGPAQARVAAMLLLTLRGTPTIYYGDEIGMLDVDVPGHLQQDPARLRGPGGGRDPERAPMRWDGSVNAGFTSGTPWLPMGDDLGSVNVASMRDDPRSIMALYRGLIGLRRAEPALAVGDWAPLLAEGDVLAFERTVPGRRLRVALNLGPRHVEVREPALRSGRVLLSTRLDREDRVARSLRLRPDEGLVLDPDG